MSNIAVERSPNKHFGALGKAPDYVHSLADTAAILGLSLATLRRMIAMQQGPKVTRLSARRLGIRDSDREAFLNR
jgi:hypothetical protein